MQTKATYKNKAEAYREFIQGRHYPVSRSKFYDDADKYDLAAADKTISLAALDAYVREVLQLDGATGQTLVSQDLADRKVRADVEYAEFKAKREKMAFERQQRELADNWIEKDSAWAQMAGIAGELRDALRHQFHLGAPGLIHLAGGDADRAPEVYEGCDELISKAMNKVCTAGRMERLFVKEEE